MLQRQIHYQHMDWDILWNKICGKWLNVIDWGKITDLQTKEKLLNNKKAKVVMYSFKNKTKLDNRISRVGKELPPNEHFDFLF